MTDAKELAYRYDLFVAPDWRDRFDTLINENIDLPVEGRFLDINTGTGSYALELAQRLKDKGDVVGSDLDAERVAIARAKALVAKADNLSFERGGVAELALESDQFDVVIGDASMLPADRVEDLLAEMIRVAQPEGTVVLKLTTRGSFDEFFSVYWEALHEAGIDDQVWAALENLIFARPTVSSVESMAERLRLRSVQTFISKEEFGYQNGDEFLESPLIMDHFLSEWLEILPEAKRNEARRHIVSTIDRDLHGATFDVSIKATILTGVK